MHLIQRIPIPVVVVRGAVAHGVGVADGETIAPSQTGHVGADGRVPIGPVGLIPAPSVVGLEANTALGGLGVGNGRRPARVDARFPGRLGEGLAVARQRAAEQVIVDADRRAAWRGRG